jgi:hypothetical protein
MTGPLTRLDQYFGTQYAAITLNTASGSTAQTVLAVPAGFYCHINGIQITVDAISTLASAGMLNTTLSTLLGCQTIALLRSYIPATAAAPTVPTVIRETSAPGAFFATAVPGDTIMCANNVALTGGSIRVSFNYGFSASPIGNN